MHLINDTAVPVVYSIDGNIGGAAISCEKYREPINQVLSVLGLTISLPAPSLANSKVPELISTGLRNERG